MTIKVGDRVPDATLSEFIETASEGCSVGPNNFQVSDLAKGKTIAVFAVPGAFTPTCSERHLPGYLELHDRIKAKGVDEIWCVAVNDPFVMGAWGRDQKVDGRVRMMADGSGDWTRKLGLELDLSTRGLGKRSQRYSALLKDGVVTRLNVEEAGKLEVSDAKTLLSQLD
ncbi:MAG: peroxiredoxin [Candidimonas sp.]|jgi:peroxiredoxin